VLEIAQPELNITRVFDAPRALVFKAWIEARHMGAWFSPQTFTSPVCELDPRPGGAIHVEMEGPDGVRYPMRGKFIEMDEPRRLVLSTYLEDGEGVFLENLVTVDFAEEGAKTRMSLSAKVVLAKAKAAPSLKGMNQGWAETIDKLGDYVTTLKTL